MTTGTPRQRYLYLVARLYDLAAEFTDSELDLMRKALRADDAKIGARAIDLLKGLHGAASGRSPESAPRTDSHEIDGPSLLPEVASSRKGVWNDRALASLLQDKTLFPSVRDISSFLPDPVSAKPKEARDRYVQRVMKYVMTLSEADKREFRDRLTTFISRKPTGFVSQWKNLIKAL
jgi:hypothetical protein